MFSLVAFPSGEVSPEPKHRVSFTVASTSFRSLLKGDAGAAPASLVPPLSPPQSTEQRDHNNPANLSKFTSAFGGLSQLSCTENCRTRKLRHRALLSPPCTADAGTHRWLAPGAPWAAQLPSTSRSTTSLCLRFWCLAAKACKAQAKNKGSNKSLLLVNYSVSHSCLKTP